MRFRRQDEVPAPSLHGFAWYHLAVVGLILVVTALALSGMGRVWWCKCGEAFLWSAEIASAHNSQHPFDPYSFTHLLHGIALYAIVWLLLGSRATAQSRAMIVVAIEAAWEIFENTSFVIERYREATISLDYYGDSIINSLSDILACIAGIAIAMTAPVWVSIGLFVGVELMLLVWIRDSLLLNIIMLFFPLEGLKSWQMGRIG
jgi:hypothetical protein